MGDIEEAFKLKATELLKMVVAKSLPREKMEEIRALFNEAKAIFENGQSEDALVLIVQAIQKFRKG